MHQPPVPSQANADRDHLRLLAIFHYVVAAISALFGSLFVVHIVGIAMIQGAIPAPRGGNLPFIGIVYDPRVFGSIAIIGGSCAVASGWTMAALLFVAGRRLAAYRSWTFCLVVAAFACMFSPFGTILGVFTIIVLCRQSVRDLFESTTGTADPNLDCSRG